MNLKVMDMEHELLALRLQLAEKSKHSLQLQKEVCFKFYVSAVKLCRCRFFMISFSSSQALRYFLWLFDDDFFHFLLSLTLEFSC